MSMLNILKAIVLLAYCGIHNTYAASDSAELPYVHSLKYFEWSHRVLLIDIKQPSHALLTTLEQHSNKIDNRDIVWFVFSNSKVVSNSANTFSQPAAKEIREKLFKNKTEAILLGKDGGVKVRQSTLDLKAIFNRIDGMPMRINEMIREPNKRF